MAVQGPKQVAVRKAGVQVFPAKTAEQEQEAEEISMHIEAVLREAGF